VEERLGARWQEPEWATVPVTGSLLPAEEEEEEDSEEEFNCILMIL